MARLDFPDCPSLRPAAEPAGLQASSSNSGALSLPDRVPWDCPGAREIGFTIPERYNASAVLFDNLAAGRGDRLAVTGPAGGRSYAQLAADAARWGNGFATLGLSRGDRILLVLDDTPIYPAAFFGAVRGGFVPILINVLTPPDLLRFYLEDSGAEVAVAEAEFYDRFEAACGGRTPLKTLVVVNGEPSTALRGVDIKKANEWLESFADRLACADTHRNDMAFWMYSSGSTGRPKGIVHLQHDMTYTHQSYSRAVLKLTPNDVCFSVPKIFFSYGFGNSITFPFFGRRGVIADAWASDARGGIRGGRAVSADGVLRVADALHAVDPRAGNQGRRFFLRTVCGVRRRNSFDRDFQCLEAGDGA